MKITFPVIAKGLIGIMFLVSILDMPGAYYESLRYISFIGFVMLSYYSYLEGHRLQPYFFIALALLLQPFVRFDFDVRWYIFMDVVVGVYLLISAFLDYRSQG